MERKRNSKSPWAKNNQVQIRRAVRSDKEKLASLIIEFLNEARKQDSSISSDARQIELFAFEHAAEMIEDEDFAAFVADDNGLVGYLGCRLFYSGMPSDNRVVANIMEIYVKPEARRKKIATALTREALGYFKRKKSTLVEVFVHDTPELAAFWNSAGFSPAARIFRKKL